MMAERTKETASATPTEQRVQVKLRRNEGQNANQDEFFSINFKNYIIKRGEFVEVPAELKEVIDNGEEALEAAYRFAEEKALNEAK
ncbi:MAG: hypothetical protein PHP50_09625 [Lachnospiraceae bacterium]|nr:hypothetical protein [Lachnospiraceae bacterium]